MQIKTIMRQRWELADLLITLAYYNVDYGRFHDDPAKLLEELNTGDTLLFETDEHTLGKGRYAAKIHLTWRGRQLYEIKRIHPDGVEVASRKPWFCSGTIKRPRPLNRPRRKHGQLVTTTTRGETAMKGAIREVKQETGLRLGKRDLVPLHGGQGQEMPLRESSVWVGLLAWEMQYHFLADRSHLDAQPWPDGLPIHEANGTTVCTEWDVQTTFPDGVYPDAHR